MSMKRRYKLLKTIVAKEVALCNNTAPVIAVHSRPWYWWTANNSCFTSY